MWPWHVKMATQNLLLLFGYACHSLTDWLTDCRLVNLMPVNDAAYAVYNWQRPSNFHQLALLHIYFVGRENFWNKSSMFWYDTNQSPNTRHVSTKLAGKTSETKALCFDMILISLPAPVTNFPSIWGESQYFIISCFPPLPQWLCNLSTAIKRRQTLGRWSDRENILFRFCM